MIKIESGLFWEELTVFDGWLDLPREELTVFDGWLDLPRRLMK